MHNNSHVVLSSVLAAFIVLLFVSCSKDKSAEPTAQVPVLTTAAASGVTQTTAQSGGTITSDFGVTVTARGVCWSTNNPTPTVTDSMTTDGAGVGSFSSSITGLTAGMSYYVRAYATNNAGTGYGSAIWFATLPAVPVLTTAAISAVTETTAECGGIITSDGGAPVTTRGVCWSTDQSPTINDSKTTDITGAGSYTSFITGLTGNTPYYVKAYATNSAGTGYGSAASFTTLPVVPVLFTAAVSAVTETTAECGGIITSDGGATVTARGVCWSTNPTPTVTDSKTSDGAGVGSFVSSITGLTHDTPYYIRAYATNSVGISYGIIRSFTTTDSMGTVTDIDGNVYQTVTIGSQVWMAENLEVTHYSNGDSIPNVTDSTVWSTLTTGAYCNYDNNTANAAVYGRLYNWYTMDDSRNIAPVGWHIPTDAEWQTLVNYLGGDAIAGGKMKETGTTHWYGPNTGATNESGFSALPGGGRDYHGSYLNMGYHAHFWSSTEDSSYSAWHRNLYYYHSAVARYDVNMPGGCSLRCVKD
jgi:uncharacterized protein (TIGR02145 family)